MSTPSGFFVRLSVGLALCAAQFACFAPAMVYAQTPAPEPETYVKQAVIYKTPKFGDATPADLLTGSEVVAKFPLVVYARNDAKAALPGQRAAGFSGIALQYIILNPGIIAPPSISDNPITANTAPCTTTEKNFQAYSNNITLTKGDYCMIHDSIVGRLSNDESKKFDHDVNPATPPIWADESWFVHQGSGANAGMRYSSNDGGGKGFIVNFKNADLRTFLVSRMMEQMLGSTRYPHVAGINGIFLDNLEISWKRLTKNNIVPAEYTASSDFAQAELSFLTQLYGHMHGGGNNFQLFGNMINGADNGNDWNAFAAAVDGGLLENFALDWGRGPYNSAKILLQLQQARSWITAQKHFIAVAQNNLWYDCPNKTTPCAQHPLFDATARYATGIYLLVADEQYSTLKIANAYGDPAGDRAQVYAEFYDYPEYYQDLGAPTATYYQVAAAPLIYRRDFACGFVEVNFSNQTATMHKTCTSPTPTASATPSPISSIIPSVVASPSPVVTPEPSATPTTVVGDVSEDGVVNAQDILLLLANWFGVPMSTNTDQNDDGVVNVLDFRIVYRVLTQ